MRRVVDDRGPFWLLEENLVLKRLELGLIDVGDGWQFRVDVAKVFDYDGGSLWLPAVYQSRVGEGRGIDADGDVRLRLKEWLDRGWPLLLATHLALNRWDERMFGSLEELAEIRVNPELSVVSVFGESGLGKSMALAILGLEDGPYEPVAMDLFGAKHVEAYIAELREKGICEMGAAVEYLRGIRKGLVRQEGEPSTVGGLLSRLANVAKGTERSVLLLDMPGMSNRVFRNVDLLDMLAELSTPKVEYSTEVGDVEAGLNLLRTVLPGKAEEARFREMVFKEAVGKVIDR